MDYFYCPPEQISSGSIVIDGDEFAHLVHVMRKKVGDEIRIVNGRGTAYDVRLDELKKKTAHGKILVAYEHHHESPVMVKIAAGLLKNPSKFDFLVEKVTEIGVRGIVPLQTDRTIPHHAKIGRWQKLALSAMKQSGRSHLPVVSELTPLDVLLKDRAPFDLKIIAHEQELPASIRIVPSPSKQDHTVLLLVGPEGGFTDDEVFAALERGFLPMYLGERRLRTETAAIVLAAATMLGRKV